MTLNFWRMCIANLLLFASAYMLFPVLSFVMPEQVGISLPQTGTIFLAFAAAMFAVGPFHAFLCDEYKRKNVLLYSTLIMLAATGGYVFQTVMRSSCCLHRCKGHVSGWQRRPALRWLSTSQHLQDAVREIWYTHGRQGWVC